MIYRRMMSHRCDGCFCLCLLPRARLGRLLGLAVLGAVLSVCGCVTREAAGPVVEVLRLAAPDGDSLVLQASGLHFGQVGRRDGLWLVCDRNSGPSANQVFFIHRDRLRAAEAGGTVVVSEAIPLVGPSEGWERFAQDRPAIPAEVIAELCQQLENHAAGQLPVLDLEGITAGRSLAGPSVLDLFVIAEQPFNLVLQLRLTGKERASQAVLVDCFLYDELASERGGDGNDGLEGIAWTGRPGEFFLAEEGTRPFRPGDELHFFDGPRLMRTRLADNRVVVMEPWSGRATESVRAQRGQPSQTLNALALWDHRCLLGVDRNGGWILATDTRTGQTARWLNLYDPALLDLRERLAGVPASRRMPYVSIEGIACDDLGNLWMVDDPAMPESFRDSCLIHLRHPPSCPRPR